MTNHDDLEKALITIEKVMKLRGEDKSSPELQSEQSDRIIAELKRRMTVVLLDILKTRRRMLIPLLYRIDVSEKKYRAALRGRSSHEIASKLADAIYERYLIKLKHRQESDSES